MPEDKITMLSKELPEQTSFLYSLSFRVSLGIIVFIVMVLLTNYFVAQTRGREVISEQANKLNHEIGQTIKLNLRERLAATESLTASLAELGLLLPKNSKTFKQIIPQIINQPGMEKIIAGGGFGPSQVHSKKELIVIRFFGEGMGQEH